MADINLLPIEERSAESFELLRRRLLFGSIGFLVFCAVSALIVLGFLSVLASKRSKLIAEVEASSSDINSLKANEELIVVVKNKAKAADAILSARSNLADVFNKLSALLPQGVYLTDLKMRSGKLVMSGRARTSGDLAGLVSALVSSRGVEIVSNVSIDSLSSDDQGAYTFIITAQLAALE